MATHDVYRGIDMSGGDQTHTAVSVACGILLVHARNTRAATCLQPHPSVQHKHTPVLPLRSHVFARTSNAVRYSVSATHVYHLHGSRSARSHPDSDRVRLTTDSRSPRVRLVRGSSHAWRGARRWCLAHALVLGSSLAQAQRGMAHPRLALVSRSSHDRCLLSSSAAHAGTGSAPIAHVKLP